jgi:hypothetical protein
VLEDANHNGVPDLCDPDTAMAGLDLGGWKRYADRPDTTYLRVVHDPGAREVLVKYTLPRGRHTVRFTMTDHATGHWSIVAAGAPIGGAFVARLATKDPATTIERGRWDLMLRIDDGVPIYKTVAWNWVGRLQRYVGHRWLRRSRASPACEVIEIPRGT